MKPTVLCPTLVLLALCTLGIAASCAESSPAHALGPDLRPHATALLNEPPAPSAVEVPDVEPLEPVVQVSGRFDGQGAHMELQHQSRPLSIAETAEEPAPLEDRLIAHQAERLVPAATGLAAGATLALIGIQAARILLGMGSGVALFSRTEGKAVLQQHTRNQIHQAIAENPGICLKELQVLLGVGWGTIVYHVARLEKARLVSSSRHRQFRRFYVNGSGIPSEVRDVAAELTNGTSKRLAMAVAQRPGIIQRELCDQIGIRPPVGHKYLARLEEADLLTRQRADGMVRYFPTKRLDALVLGEAAPLAQAQPLAATA